MGDRGNIVARQAKGTNRNDVWFYTHWSGSEREETVREALSLNERWDDPSYLARIIFDKLTGGDASTTGFGISTTLQDNEHPICVVDIPEQVVRSVPEGSLVEDDNGFRLPDDISGFAGVPFEEFCKATSEKN